MSSPGATMISLARTGSKGKPITTTFLSGTNYYVYTRRTHCLQANMAFVCFWTKKVPWQSGICE